MKSDISECPYRSILFNLHEHFREILAWV